jgi:hypothetical protein
LRAVRLEKPTGFTEAGGPVGQEADVSKIDVCDDGRSTGLGEHQLFAVHVVLFGVYWPSAGSVYRAVGVSRLRGSFSGHERL